MPLMFHHVRYDSGKRHLEASDRGMFVLLGGAVALVFGVGAIVTYSLGNAGAGGAFLSACTGLFGFLGGQRTGERGVSTALNAGGPEAHSAGGKDNV
jgi:hypothetical protein